MERPRRRRRSWLRTALPSVVALLLLVGCADGPGERYAQAVVAAKKVREGDKSSRTQAVDEMLHYFTASSADVFRGVHEVKTRASQYTWTDISKLLVEGKVLEVKEDGEMRILVVENSKGKKFEIRMLLEDGLWVVDGLDLTRFWQRLKSVDL